MHLSMNEVHNSAYMVCLCLLHWSLLRIANGLEKKSMLPARSSLNTKTLKRSTLMKPWPSVQKVLEQAKWFKSFSHISYICNTDACQVQPFKVNSCTYVSIYLYAY